MLIWTTRAHARTVALDAGAQPSLPEAHSLPLAHTALRKRVSPVSIGLPLGCVAAGGAAVAGIGTATWLIVTFWLAGVPEIVVTFAYVPPLATR